jgi:hypothetical protein
MPKDEWHLSKSVPLSLILALVLQFAGGVYYAGQLRADVNYNTEKITTLQEDVDSLEANVHSIDVQLGRIETHLLTILERINGDD